MPDKKTLARAHRAKRLGKAPTTQAGEFVRTEMEHVRTAKHGARSTKQAIAIGLSKARRAGIRLSPPRKGKTSEKSRRGAMRAAAAGRKRRHKTAPTRSRAITRALRREGHAAASPTALSRHAVKAAHQRTAAERSASARKGMRQRTHAERSASARKAARTRWG